MSRSSTALLLATLASAAVLAQPRPAPRADPLDPRASTPPLVHRSALANYRAQARADDTPVPWRDANDAVERIGGWRAYAREAAAAAASAPTSASPPAPARAASAAGHRH